MNAAQTVLLAIIAGAVLFGLIFDTPTEQFSYVIISPDDEKLMEELNKAGERGYQVVAARRATSGRGEDTKASYEMILMKRGRGLSSALTPPVLPR